MTQICDISDVLMYLGIASSATDAQRARLEFCVPLAEGAVRDYLGFTATLGTYTHYLPHRSVTDGELVGRDVINNRVVDEYAGGYSELWLPERPVRVDGSYTITVYEDLGAYGGQGASDFSASALTQGTDYYVDYEDDGIGWSGKLVRISGTWSSRARTIKATYTAGLTGGELDSGTIRGPGGADTRAIKNAAVLAVVLAYKQATQTTSGESGIIAERLGDYSVTYGHFTAAVTAFLRELPDQCQRMLSSFRRLAR